MITHVSVYMYCVNGAHPFACIHRGDKMRFCALTNRSAWGLAFACTRRGGRFIGTGQGWDWVRV